MNKIKIFGERNTGTNYLVKLIENNLNVKLFKGVVPKFPNYFPFKFLNNSETYKDLYFLLFNRFNFGWKHSYLDLKILSKKIANDSNFFVVLIVKNPYSFLLSLNKNPYHNYSLKNINFKSFLSSPWKIYLRDNYSKEYIDPIELWNVKTIPYLKLKELFPNNVFIVKYESLISNPEGVIKEISVFTNTSYISSFKNHISSTKNEQKDFNYYSDYYLNERWISKLDSESIDYINSKLDHNLCESLGYSIKFLNN